MALGVQHQPLARADPVGFHLGEDVVDILAGPLDTRVDHIGGRHPGRAGDHGQTRLVEVAAVQTQLLGRDDQARSLLDVGGVQAKAGATRHRDTDVAVRVVVAAAKLQDRAPDITDGEILDIKAEGVSGKEQTAQVLVQPENTPVVGADPLEDRIPVEVAVVEQRHRRGRLCDIRAINENEVFSSHRKILPGGAFLPVSPLPKV
jgi:hypothetical protein